MGRSSSSSVIRSQGRSLATMKTTVRRRRAASRSRRSAFRGSRAWRRRAVRCRRVRPSARRPTRRRAAPSPARKPFQSKARLRSPARVSNSSGGKPWVWNMSAASAPETIAAMLLLHLLENPLDAVQPGVDRGEEAPLFLFDDAGRRDRPFRSARDRDCFISSATTPTSPCRNGSRTPI